jgi:diacylglycerol kinase family enzyme
VEQQLLFGVLPAGTFNYFGRSYGIPTDIAEATRTLIAAVERPVQVGLVNGRVFLVNASVGLYPELLEDREAFKKRFGRTRFVAMCAGLATLFRDHRSLLLEYDHQGEKRTTATSTLFVGNSRLQLEQVGIEEATVVRQGQLAAVVVGAVGKLGLARAAIRGALGSLGDAEGVDSFSFTQLVVKLRGSRGRLIKVATDGEIAMLSSPLTFTVEPRTLRLLRLPVSPFEAAR